MATDRGDGQHHRVRTMTTTQPRKQRKALYNAPWQKRRRLMSAHLSEEYLEDKKRDLPRAVPVRKGDVVKIMRGDDSGKEGKVATIDYRALRITVEGVTHAKSDGKQVAKSIHPSNVLIVKLDETDPLRLRRFEGGKR
nr:large subunit ribosomal protein L24 [uncultured archaeon]